MTLREQLIEAGALVLHNKSPKCYESFGDYEDGCRCVVKAGLSLDAILDTLEANADEWVDASQERLTVVVNPDQLIAVLRAGDSENLAHHFREGKMKCK